MKIKKFIDVITETGVVVNLTGMICSVVIQVFTRFFMTSAPHWTEEAARIFFIFSVAFGAGLAIKSNAYVRLDFFLDKLPDQLRNAVHLIIQGVITILGATISFYSIRFIGLGASETSPSLQINMSYIFSSMLILGVLITYYSGYAIVFKIKQSGI